MKKLRELNEIQAGVSFWRRSLRNQLYSLIRGLSNLAYQTMRFIGPWRDRGIAEQPIEFEFRNAVAFAGPLLQRLMIEDPDVAAPIVDQPGFLQGTHHVGHRCAPDAEHHAEEFMREQEIAGRHPVPCHQ